MKLPTCFSSSRSFMELLHVIMVGASTSNNNRQGKTTFVSNECVDKV